MTFHVLVPDAVDPKAVQILTDHPDFTVTGPGKFSREEALAQVKDADAMVIRSGITVDAEMIDAAPKLKIIARAGVGVDNVDLDKATERGIYVVNTPDGNTISTAEHTFGLMLALARHIPQGHQSMREGRWDRKAFTGLELRGKTLGVVGFGRIGRAVAVRAKAFEMTVIAHDPFPNTDAAQELGVELVALDDLFARADFITLHTALLDETREMICAETLAKMKNGVRIINAARGALINDTDLAAAIQSGKVAGAALDVFQPEPPSADNPLIGLNNVIHTPHLAASTTDAQVNVGFDAVRLVIAALADNDIQTVVNVTVLNR